MTENRKSSDALQKSDIQTIIEVNKKAIELQSEISDQFETIINSNGDIARELSKVSLNQEYIENDLREVIKEIKKEIKNINDNQRNIIILLSSGVLSVLAQILTTIFHK